MIRPSSPLTMLLSRHTRRREFITLLGGAAAAWPLAARAQQARVPTIGWLGGATRAAQGQWAIAFTQRLRMLGGSEGSTVVIEYRWAEGRPERFAEIAAEFVRLKVDVILAAGTEAALAAKHSDCLPGGGGPGRHRPGRISGATGRQRHRRVEPVQGSCCQATRALEGGCSRSAPLGDPAQCRLPRWRVGNGRSSLCGAHAGHRGHPI